jgi:predicted Zn finger-like uncharacterized protein
MRLVCPNCDAEYEVDASAIPDTGRDVQCSNCGHAWFQLSPRLEDELAAEKALFDPPEPAAPEPAAAFAAPREPELTEAAAPTPKPDDGYEEEEEATPPVVAAPAARTLDESLLAVLREEAERETAARRNDPPPMEMQTELGLAAAVAATVSASAQPDSPADDTPADPVAARVARMKGIAPAPAKPQARRDMLPEIDEINTTLRASSEPREGDAGAVADNLTGRSGRGAFRSGFVLMMLAAVLIVAVYVMAPKLSEQIPGLKGTLTAYVAAIDAARLWLDGVLRAGITLMRGASDNA